VDELNHSGQIDALLLDARTAHAQGMAHQHEQHGAHALAARGKNVLRHLRHQHNARLQLLGNQAVERLHICGKQIRGGGGG